MGSSNSRRRNPPKTPIPPYGGSSPGLSRPGLGMTPGFGTGAPINRDQQRELMMANQTIANLNNQIQAMQRGGAGVPPMGYGAPPIYTPPSPGLPHAGGFSPYSYPPPSPVLGGGGGGGVSVYRDNDFASIANIAGLNPADVALLHREFMNLTRGGTNKMDRTIFRHLLRDILLEVNNEHVDRTIENMFVTIDRNRDGFIDFPEFVGAFKDVLKGHIPDAQGYFSDSPYPDVLTEQLRASGVGSGIAAQPIAYAQQPQLGQFISGGGLNIVPLASTGIQQAPLLYTAAAPMQLSNATPPMLTLDPNQSSYVIATPGQYLITEPTALQCVPLPVM